MPVTAKLSSASDVKQKNGKAANVAVKAPPLNEKKPKPSAEQKGKKVVSLAAPATAPPGEGDVVVPGTATVPTVHARVAARARKPSVVNRSSLFNQALLKRIANRSQFAEALSLAINEPPAVPQLLAGLLDASSLQMTPPTVMTPLAATLRAPIPHLLTGGLTTFEVGYCVGGSLSFLGYPPAPAATFARAGLLLRSVNRWQMPPLFVPNEAVPSTKEC